MYVAISPRISGVEAELSQAEENIQGIEDVIVDMWPYYLRNATTDGFSWSDIVPGGYHGEVLRYTVPEGKLAILTFSRQFVRDAGPDTLLETKLWLYLNGGTRFVEGPSLVSRDYEVLTDTFYLGQLLTHGDIVTARVDNWGTVGDLGSISFAIIEFEA
ncbi:MAG: hypothetical protein ACUVTD_01345 [Nitrososphaerales archaeon]